MSRKEERVNYAMSFEGKGMDNEELKENIRLAILDGATWADKTILDKMEEYLRANLWEVASMDCIARQKFVTNLRKALED